MGGVQLREVCDLVAHEGTVSSVQFQQPQSGSSSDSSLLASCGSDRRIVIWRIRAGDDQGGMEVVRFNDAHESGVNDVHWHPDSATPKIASAGDDYCCAVWDCTTQTKLRRLRGHRQAVLQCRWHPDGTLLATGSMDHSVILWDTRMACPVRRLVAHSDPVLSLDWTNDGDRLLTASCDGLMRVWSPHESNPILEMAASNTEPFCCARFSPNKKFVLSASLNEGPMRLWAVDTQKIVLRLQSAHTHKDNFFLCEYAFASQKRPFVVTGDSEGRLSFYSLSTGKVALQEKRHDAPLLALATLNASTPLVATSALRPPVREDERIDTSKYTIRVAAWKETP
ncbi:MAG: hypothetical protein MHM6MM_002974 [Cercozoa sp. M6MM]